MNPLQQRLTNYERKLDELTSSNYGDASTPEVRALLIETCKAAIAQIKQDIAEEQRPGG